MSAAGAVAETRNRRRGGHARRRWTPERAHATTPAAAAGGRVNRAS